MSDYENLLRKLSEKISLSWKRKRENDKSRMPSRIIWLISLTTFLSFLYSYLFYIAPEEENGEFFITIGTITVAIAVLLIMCMSVYNFRKSIKEFQTLGEITKEMLEPTIKEYNQFFPNIHVSYDDKRYVLTIYNKLYEDSEDSRVNSLYQ